MAETIRVQKQCPTCQGYGYVSLPSTKGFGAMTCPSCGGSGTVFVDQPIMDKKKGSR